MCRKRSSGSKKDSSSSATGESQRGFDGRLNSATSKAPLRAPNQQRPKSSTMSVVAKTTNPPSKSSAEQSAPIMENECWETGCLDSAVTIVPPEGPGVGIRSQARRQLATDFSDPAQTLDCPILASAPGPSHHYGSLSGPTEEVEHRVAPFQSGREFDQGGMYMKSVDLGSGYPEPLAEHTLRFVLFSDDALVPSSSQPPLAGDEMDEIQLDDPYWREDHDTGKFYHWDSDHQQTVWYPDEFD